MEIFSKRLKYEREVKGYSQRTMSELLGISQSTYMHYELLGTTNGREPPMELMKRIADIFDVSLDYLFGRID